MSGALRSTQGTIALNRAQTRIVPEEPLHSCHDGVASALSRTDVVHPL
jgi:hypothetical protein